jgi:serine/threonine-protein kinase
MLAESNEKSEAPAQARDVPKEGDVIAGKYRVERVLGAGGMGVVVAAHHILLDEKVALKFLLPAARVNKEAVARFMREAQAATRIKSEHVAQVKDVGKLDDGAPYIVMEFLDGSDLSTWLTELGPLPVDQTVDFVLQACEAIAEAHAHGIVHRDLKPPNLFCVRKADGALCIKVLDFGISKISSKNGSPQLTQTTHIMGSPLYMSPEQMSDSKAVDGRSDIWALGVILFELLTGRLPFESEAVTALAVKITNEPAPVLSSLRRDVPRGLDAVLARCFEKEKENRYQTVAELASALEGFGTPRARLSVERVRGVQKQTSLSESARVLQELPRASMPMTSYDVDVSGAPKDASPRSADTVFGARRTPRHRLQGRIVMATSVVALLAATVVFVRASLPAPLAAAAPSPVPSTTVAPPVATPPPPPPPAPPPSDIPPAPMAPVAPTAVTSAAAPPAPAARAIATRPAAARPSAPAAAPPANQAKCNPPYIIDAAGHHKYKPECL